MSETDSRIRFNLRHILLACVIIVSMVMLWWMYTEQDHISKCKQMIGANENGLQKSIQVVMQNSLENQTKALLQHVSHVQKGNQNAPVDMMKWNYNWDSKIWKNQSEAVGVPARSIILVRHGQYNFRDGQLNDMGRRQANLTGLRLKELGMNIAHLTHSTMDRARQTAEILKQHLPPDVSVDSDDMLQEGGPVHPDPTISYWGLPDRNYHVDGPRLEAAFRKYFYRADKSEKEQKFHLFVGHSNSFRFFILRALQLPPHAWMRFFLPHASITLLHINSDSTVTMTKCGDSGHLPKDMVTY